MLFSTKCRHFRFKLYAVALFLLTLIYFLSPYQMVIVIGESMSPTLNSGQIVILNKLERNPKKNDIIVIRKNHTFYIKRVLMTYEDRFLIINNDIDYHDALKLYKNKPVNPTEANVRIQRFIDHAKKIHNVLIDLRPGECWVEGDNRQHSEDSRIFGAVKQSEILGTCQTR